MLLDDRNIPLEVVDGLTLDAEYQELLRPDETIIGHNGMTYRLPRYFFVVDSYEIAKQIKLAPNFFISEFLETDYKEADLQRDYPKYIPTAVTLMAAALGVLRKQVRSSIRIATNGGYRSPHHSLNTYMSPHCWGTAVNIYRIGNKHLNNQAIIDKYAEIIKKTLPGVWVRPYGTTVGTSFDQLHLDIGFTTAVPKKLRS